MQKIFIVISFIAIYFGGASSIAHSASVEIKVRPERPIKNENFNLIFTIDTDSEEEPYISFDPSFAEVLGRSNQTSEQITIINGKIGRRRSMTYIYDLVSAKSGSLYIKDITIDVDGEKLKHKNVRINVLSKRSTPSNMFLQAEITQDKIYVGQGFDINYYLYTRVNIMGSEIKAFPKLKNFSKRFKMVRDAGVVVEKKGVMYRKLLKYSARVFAEKPGETTIDPLHLTVQYTASRNRQSSYGLFGSVFSRPKLKNLRSPKIKIKINKLPSDGVPTSFTGLVGIHKFQFAVTREKYLVNEAVEAKFQVEGVGALENYSAPHLYTHDDLESFDIKSDLIDINHIKKKKLFDYTYLARAPFLLQGKEVFFSYFDPEIEKYVEVSVSVPSLKISGVAMSGRSSSIKNFDQNQDTKLKSSISENQDHAYVGNLLAPVFDTKYIYNSSIIFKVINYTLVTLIVICLYIILGGFKSHSLTFELLYIFKDIKKNGINYSKLFKLLNHISPNDLDLSVKQKILKSKLPAKTKNYFDKLVESSATAGYKSDTNAKLKYDSKHFDVLKDYLKRMGKNKPIKS